MKEDTNCSGQGGDGCNSSPLWAEEKRATFNGPIWSVLGTWTSTLSGQRVQRDARVLRRQQDPHHRQPRRHVGSRRCCRRTRRRPLYDRAHLSRGRVRRVDDGRPRRREQLLHQSTPSRTWRASTSSRSAGSSRESDFLMDIDASQKGRWGFPVDVCLQPRRSEQPSRHVQCRPSARRRTSKPKWNYCALRAGHVAGDQRPDVESRDCATTSTTRSRSATSWSTRETNAIMANSAGRRR